MAENSLGPKRLHPTWIVLGLIRTVRAFALPLVIFLVSGRGGEQGYFFLIAGGIALAGAGVRAAMWWMLRYEIAGGELRVRSGVIARQERSVPLERIQAVDSSESVLQRMLGVVQIRIETAAGGGRGSDVTLEALSRADAATLRDRLGAARRVANPMALPDEGPPVGSAAVVPLASPNLDRAGALIRAITPGELLAAGATSGRVGPALAILFAAYQVADDVLPNRIWETLAMSAPGLTVRGLLLTAGIVGVGAWLLAMVSTVLTFGGFELRREGDRLHLSSGLLDRRRSTIPIGRVQAVTISEGMLRQPFGWASVRIESAGYGKDTAESGVLFPLIRCSEIPALLRQVVPDFAAAIDRERLQALPTRARQRYAMAEVWPLLVLTLVLSAVAAATDWFGWRWGVLPLVGVPLAALYGLIAFRDTGWTIDGDDRLIVRSRQVARFTTITPRRRLQRRSVDQNPLQRRARLATFRAAVASGGGGGQIEIKHVDELEAVDLLGRLGPAAVPTAAIGHAVIAGD